MCENQDDFFKTFDTALEWFSNRSNGKKWNFSPKNLFARSTGLLLLPFLQLQPSR
jgi:hypothetical protein